MERNMLEKGHSGLDEHDILKRAVADFCQTYCNMHFAAEVSALDLEVKRSKGQS